MDSATAESIIDYRVDEPFTDKNNFLSFADLKTIIPITDDLSVNTNYFMLETNIVIGDARVTVFSIIHRDPSAGTVAVTSRSQSVY